MARKFNQRVNVIPNSVRNLLVAITLLLATTFTANAQVRTITFTGNTGITGGAGDVTKLNRFDVRWHLDNAPGGAVGATEQFIAEIGPQVCSLILSGTSGAFDRDGNVRCENIIGVILPPSLTFLSSCSFFMCISLQEVTINGNVTYMASAFQACYNLSSITFTQTTQPTYMWGSFLNAGSGGVDVYIPCVAFGNPTIKSQWQTALANANLTTFTLTEIPNTAPFDLIAEINNSTYGEVTTLPTTTTGLACGDEVVLTATAGSCYQFVNWTNSSNAVVSTTNPLSVIVGSDTTLKANFTIKKHTLTLNSGGNGSVSGAGSNLNCGSSQTITAIPNACYQFDNWTNSSDVEVSDANQLSVTLNSDTTLKANFTIKKHTLTLNSGGNGSVSGAGSNLNCGSSQTITATPDAGYRFVNWVYAGTSVVVATNKSYDFRILKDTTLVAVFEAIPTYTVSVSAGNNGTYTLTPDKASYYEGENVVIKFIPDAGYKVASVSGISAPYKIIGISKNYSISVEFEKKVTRIGRINIKQGKLEIKPRK